jgi:hypothetical protein
MAHILNILLFEREVFMTFKYWNWAGIVVFAIVGVIACGKGSSTNSNLGNYAVVPTGTNVGCPAGSQLTYAYGYPMCQGPNGLTSPIYQNVMGGNQYQTDNYCYRNLTVTDSGVFRSFLKEAMGVCDQAHSNGGMADCASWTSGYVKVELMSSGNQMNIAFYGYPYVNPYYSYSYQMPSLSDFFLGMMGFPMFMEQQTYSVMQNPLYLSMAVYPINDSKGFEGRTYGNMYTVANRSLIQVQIAQGRLGDPSFNYVLSYAPTGTSVSTPFLSGTLINKAAYGSMYYGCY